MNSVRKATDIPKAVKDRVFERDNGCCIFCGHPGMPNAHYIRRSQLGLGIEENIVTACIECHRAMDEGKFAKEFKAYARDYLKEMYKDWDERKLVYRKGTT